MSDTEDQRTAAPILAALAVVVVGIAIVFLLRANSDSLSDSNRIATTATDYVAAHNGEDVPALARLSCAEAVPDEAPLAGRDGAVELIRVAGIQGDGRRATAEVTVSANGTETSTTWVFTHVGEDWLVCGKS